MHYEDADDLIQTDNRTPAQKWLDAEIEHRHGNEQGHEAVSQLVCRQAFIPGLITSPIHTQWDQVMKDIELLPCPFCGSDDIAFSSNGHDSEFVECMACGSSGPVAVGFLATSEAWNARAAVESDRAQRVPDVDALADKIAECLRGTYHCNRVWEAWHVGTMSQDDFEPVDESETPREIAEEIAALLASTPAQPAPKPVERKPMPPAVNDVLAERHHGIRE